MPGEAKRHLGSAWSARTLLIGGSIALGIVTGIGGSASVAGGIVVVLCIVGLYLWDAELAVLCYFASRPVADLFVYTHVGPFTLGQLWGAGLITLTAAYLMTQRAGKPRVFARGDWIPILFGVVYAFTVLPRMGDATAISNALKVASWLAVLLVFRRIAQSDRGRNRIRGLGYVLAALIVLMIGYAVATNQYGAAYYAGQLGEIGQGPHGLSSMAMLAIGFLVVAPRRGHPTSRTLLVALLGLCVVLSLVRTTLLALVVFAIAVLLMDYRRFARRRILTTVAVGAAGIVGYMAIRSEIVQRWGDLRSLTYGVGASSAAGSGRFGVWELLLDKVLHDPTGMLFGYGPQMSNAFIESRMGVNIWAHSDFVEFLVTGGLPLLLMYALLLIWMMWSGTLLARCQLDGVRHPGRAFVALTLAYIVMAALNGIAYYQASLVMAAIAGYVSGWRSSIETEHDTAAAAARGEFAAGGA